MVPKTASTSGRAQLRPASHLSAPPQAPSSSMSEVSCCAAAPDISATAAAESAVRFCCSCLKRLTAASRLLRLAM